jgi:hypothetical protein
MAYSRGYLSFQCGICGRFSRAQNRVPQCMVCMRPLCNDCIRAGFCAEHFAQLTPEDQALATQLYSKLQASRRVWILTSVFGFIIFMVAILSITLIPFNTYVYNSTNPYDFIDFTPFLIIFPMILLFACTFGGIFYYTRVTRATWRQLDLIGSKYRTPSNYHYTAPPWNSPNTATNAPFGPLGPSAAPPSPPLAQPKAQIQFCPHCGNRVTPSTQYCPSCGGALL